jgi:hypothetical protein
MNETFKQLSLLAGGAHYPTINPNLQQQFGELIVRKIVERIEAETNLAWEQNEIYAGAALSSLSLQILEDFDMVIPDEDWDAEAELQKIFDEFDMPGNGTDKK